MAYSVTEGKKPQDWINLILGICLFLSPWALGFAGEINPAWNAWIVAAAMGAIAVVAISAFAEWEEWVNLVLGLWLIAAPWVLGFAANVNAMWTHVVVGVLAAAVSAWALWDYRHDRHVTA
jgi:hypothetical protein